MKYLGLLLLLLSSLRCEQRSPLSDNKKIHVKTLNLTTHPSGLSKLVATLKTVHGNLKIQFYPNKAPHTVARLLELIRSGLYDGLIFHKVIPRFIVQTGDPTGTGKGGSGTKLQAEFNDIPHIRGTVSMARSLNEGAQDSADSQFFISLSTLQHFDGKFTVVGLVTDGLDILDKITVGDKVLAISLDD